SPICSTCKWPAAVSAGVTSHGYRRSALQRCARSGSESAASMGDAAKAAAPLVARVRVACIGITSVAARNWGFSRVRAAKCGLAAILLAATIVAPAAALAAEDDLLDQGHDLYDDNCAMCHGRNMVNPGTLSFDLRKFPKDDLARFRNSVINGKNAMPAW